MAIDRPSSWFEDQDVLVAELRRGSAVPRGTPEIPGYDNLRELARGGQGVVYTATQRSTRRAVAIKVLLDGAISSGAARRRFEREIDLVAGLRHPNIVSVYDSGVTEDGRLYLVMELVEGVPLDQAMRAGDGGMLPIREQIGVFAEACDAVHYAHQRGVIHRDLKPSNIRVDRAGHPKVLDFGLAKAAGLESALTVAPGGPSVLSVSGQFVGSLPWASPEQAGGNPDLIDLRSDVYALGVMLYQVLTGEFPYDVSGSLRTTLDHIAGSPPRPARALRRGVDDELETILGKALAKEASRRYQSAGDLAIDLRHYLRGEPIAAKRDSAWYTLRKTLRRYRLLAGASGIALVAILGGSLVAVQQARRASSERDTAQRERDVAKRALARSDATVRFLKDLLGAASPNAQGGGKDARVVDMLDRAASQMDAQYAGDRATLASLHGTLADAYSKLDLTDKGLEQARAAYNVLRSLPEFGPAHPETIAAHGSIGSCLVASGQYAEAVKVLEEVATEHAGLASPRPMDVLSTYSDLGMCYRRVGRFDDAERSFQKAWSVLPESERDSDSAISLGNNHATLKQVVGDLPESERLYRQVLASLDRRSMGEQADAVVIASNLALTLMYQGKHKEAVEVLEPKRAACERIFPPEHVTRLIFASNLGTAYQRLKDFDKAEQTMRRAIEAREAKTGPDDAELLTTRSNLYTVLMDAKKFEEAASVIADVVERSIRVLGEKHHTTLISRNNHAIVLDRLGRLEEAEGEMRRVVELSQPEHGVFPAGAPEPQVFRNVLANVLIKERKFEEAERILQDVIAILRARVGESNSNTTYAYSCLVTLYTKWEKPAELERARSLYEASKAGAH